MQCCPECLAVIQLYQSSDPTQIPTKDQLVTVPGHIAPHRRRQTAPTQQHTRRITPASALEVPLK